MCVYINHVLSIFSYGVKQETGFEDDVLTDIYQKNFIHIPSKHISRVQIHSYVP